MREPSAFALRGWRLPAAGPLSTQRFCHRDPQARARSTSGGRGADHADLRGVQVQRASGGGCGSECRRVLSSTRPESRRARTRPVPRQGHAVRPRARGPCAVADRFVFCVCEIQVSKAHSSGQATTSPQSKDGADALHGVQRNKREAAVAPGHEGGTPGGQKLPALLAAPAPQPAQPGRTGGRARGLTVAEGAPAESTGAADPAVPDAVSSSACSLTLSRSLRGIR